MGTREELSSELTKAVGTRASRLKRWGTGVDFSSKLYCQGGTSPLSQQLTGERTIVRSPVGVGPLIGGRNGSLFPKSEGSPLHSCRDPCNPCSFILFNRRRNLVTFGDKCPRNGSKDGVTAPRTGTGWGSRAWRGVVHGPAPRQLSRCTAEDG